MKFLDYLENKVFYILFQIFSIIFLALILFMANFSFYYILFISSILILLLLIFLIIDYVIIKRKSQKIMQLVDSLEEKYYISEVIPKSSNLENKAYIYALREATKKMNDKLGDLEQEKEDYQEYIESFVHEIKTPISALMLTFDEKKDIALKLEIDKINMLVEQILFLARSNDTANDYFIKKINLSDLVHKVILKYKYYLLHSKIELNIHDLDETIYTDEKWLLFVIAQVIQNSIKYVDKSKKIIEIYSKKEHNKISLIIKDNGCGIKESDLRRVFQKGFTGSDRLKKATGMGLYLAKKICDNLGLNIELTSIYKKETTVKIIIPKSNFNHLQ